MEDDDVQTIEDPLHKTATAKDVYDEVYGTNTATANYGIVRRRAPA